MSIRHWDDECEDVIHSVTSYYFVGDKGEPVCYSVLPIRWCEEPKVVDVDRKIILQGFTSSGHQKVYKQVKAWKFDLSSFDQVKVEVLSKENKWIVLDEPRKSYEEIIRTIRLNLCCLQYLKRNPHASGSSLLSNVSPSFDRGRLSLKNDLRGHLTVIKSAVEHDNTLKTSKFLLTFLESPRKAFTENKGAGLVTKKAKLNVKDDHDELNEEKTNTDDTACAICDNGGNVLCCDGECKRCFHATVADAGADAQKFICLNCKYRQHQCFVCGKLGSSDCSSAREVFSCASCGHFYHPKCAADFLYPTNEVENKRLQKIIAAGGSFTCPAHKCYKCKQAEDSPVHELQFAVCRRCPKAYHRKCLPRGIAFGYAEKLGLVQRAWDNLLPRNRILLYCQNHKIEKDQGTPSRNHIVFPNVVVKAKVQSTQSGQQRVLKRKRMIPEELQERTSVRPRNSVEMMAPSKQSKFVENKPKRVSVQQLVSTKRLSTCSASKVIPKDSFMPVIDLSYKQQKVLARPICSKPSPGAEAGKRSNYL
ncbi:hypothetical protein MKW92_049052 [Papaver armeniacum]|nr:hypothetical protein MKW92_049052 [Papaver armeniacum]